MSSAQNQIMDRVNSGFATEAFVPADFLDIAARGTIKMALSRLEAQGLIRRLVRGVYSLPRYSELVRGYVDPGPDAVVAAIARANRWKVVPSGDTALNAIGMSTQVPASYEYVSSGPYKNLRYKGTDIRLLHRADQDFYDDPDLRRTMIIIQALKAIGVDRIDDDVIDALDKRLSDDDIKKLYDNTQYGISWIYKTAQRLYERRFNG